MTRKSTWPAVAILACVVVAGAGCTRGLREARHLRRGDSDVAAGNYSAAEIEYRVALRYAPGDPDALGDLGTLYYNEGRVLAGYILLHHALAVEPDNARFQLTYGLACLTLVRIPEARTAAKKAVAALGDDQEAMVLLADTSESAQDEAESEKIIEGLRKTHRDAAGFHLAIGVLQLADGNGAGAEREFKKALELDPKSGAAYAELGRLFLGRNDLRQAGPALKMAAELSPIRSPRRIAYVRFLVKTGDVDGARKELAAMTTKAPDYIPAWAEAMRLAADRGDSAEALRATGKILNLDPANYDALEQRVKLAMDRDDPDDALANLQQLAHYYPQAPQLKYQAALAYLKKRDASHAEDNLSEAILLAPHYDDAILLLAELRLRKGEAAQVVSTMKQLLRREPGNREARFFLAQAFQDEGNFESALEIFQALGQASPNSPEGPYLVGTVLLELNQNADARQAFERSVRLSETYWPSQEMLVELDLAARRPADAERRARRLLQAYPKAAVPWVLRAKIRIAGGDSAGAESDLLKAIQLDPNSQVAYLELARIYVDRHQARQALEKLGPFAARTHSIPALMQVGMLHGALNESEAARSAYEELLTINPDFSPALNNLAVLYSEKLGQPERAYTLAQRAREFAPGDPVVADTLGWILYRRGDLAGALALLRESAGRDPTSPDIEYHLGMVYYMLGREESARQAFQIAKASADPVIRQGAARRLAVLAIDPATASASVRADLLRRANGGAQDPVLLERLADIEMRDGSAEDAARHYEAALKLAPTLAPVMVELARLYSGPLHDLDRVRQLVQSAHAIKPNDPRVTWALGGILYRTGDYKWSVDLLEQAQETLPNEPDLSYALAQGYYSIGRVADAETEIQPALASRAPFKRREDASRLATMMAAAEGRGNLPKALQAAREALAADPGYVPALMIVGLDQERKGDYAGAGRTYETVLAKDSLFASAARRLAILYAEKLGNDARAEELANQARASFPDDPELEYELGVLSYRRADYSDAVKFLQESEHGGAASAEAYFYLGVSHFQLKDTADAKDELQQALALNLPIREADEAKRVLAQLSQGPAGSMSGAD